MKKILILILAVMLLSTVSCGKRLPIYEVEGNMNVDAMKFYVFIDGVKYKNADKTGWLFDEHIVDYKDIGYAGSRSLEIRQAVEDVNRNFIFVREPVSLFSENWSLYMQREDMPDPPGQMIDKIEIIKEEFSENDYATKEITDKEKIDLFFESLKKTDRYEKLSKEWQVLMLWCYSSNMPEGASYSLSISYINNDCVVSNRINDRYIIPKEIVEELFEVKLTYPKK